MPVVAPNVEYTAYSGRQQNWPVASGSFVSQKYGLPVYFGPPDRPYRVLGYMETQSAPLAMWETGKSESIKPAVKEAMKHGADALVLLASGTNVAGSTTFGSAQWRSNTTTTEAFTATILMLRARQREAVSAQVRQSQSGKATLA
ncbi:MAG TPA: hypothetical protein VFU09_06495 [Candidatus Udaeobacter sp.]|nr:hypothetical protein [Candidatus Udaeobacter sp.]